MDAPAATPFEMIGGERIVTEIVDRFYDLIEGDTAYADLRAVHADDLSTVRQGLAGYLIGWLGGPRDWFEQGKCVVSLHGSINIPPAVGQQWGDAMKRAIAAQPNLDPPLAEAMAARLGDMAMGMVNQP